MTDAQILATLGGNRNKLAAFLRDNPTGKDILYAEIVFCRWFGALPVGCGHDVYGCVR